MEKLTTLKIIGFILFISGFIEAALTSIIYNTSAYSQASFKIGIIACLLGILLYFVIPFGYYLYDTIKEYIIKMFK